MNDFFGETFNQWVIILPLGFVVLFTLVGFVIKKRRKLNREITAPKIMRFMVLPTAFIYLFLTKVISVDTNHIFIKSVETILIIFIISFLLNMINHLFFSDDNIFTRKETIPKLARDIIYAFLILLASTIVVSVIWGVDLGNLLTALGVGSFVIGLALQEPLGNLFNGVSLLMAKPFRKGDWISIDNEVGKVEEFNWSSIKIINLYNELIIIPNNKFAKDQIKNLSRPNRIHAELVTIGFSYNDHPVKVKEVLAGIAVKTEGVLKNPAPKPLTISYEDFYIKYGLKFYIKDFEDLLLLKDRLMTQMYIDAKENGLTIPFPIRDIIMRETKNSINPQ